MSRVSEQVQQARKGPYSLHPKYKIVMDTMGDEKLQITTLVVLLLLLLELYSGKY